VGRPSCASALIGKGWLPDEAPLPIPIGRDTVDVAACEKCTNFSRSAILCRVEANRSQSAIWGEGEEERAAIVEYDS